MKKVSLAVGFVLLGMVTPLIGMAISPTRDLILGLAPDEAILKLADKIDQESTKNANQEEAISKLNTSNEQQKEQLDNIAKQQEISACSEKQQQCESKITLIGTKEIVLSPKNNNIPRTSREDMIKQIEGRVKECKKTRDSGEFNSDTMKTVWESCIKDGERDIAQIKGVITAELIEKNNLLNGECADYKNPCK